MGSHVFCTNESASDGSPSAVQQVNWVVKGPDRRFNQFDPAHGQIVGTTKTSSSLIGWALSCNVRSQIAAATRKMFAFGLDDQLICNISSPASVRRDHSDECQVLQCL